MILIAVLAGLAGLTPAWRLLRHAVTFAHEGGHTVVAMGLGARVKGIRLSFDTSGLTTWEQKQGFGRIRRGLVAVAGYPAPGAAAAGLATAASAGHTDWAFFALAGAVAVVALLIRNFWGLVVIGVAAAICAAGWHYGATDLVIGAAIGLWAVGGVRAATEAWRSKARKGDGSDAGQLSTVIGGPAPLWAFVMVTVAVAGAAFAAWELHYLIQLRSAP